MLGWFESFVIPNQYCPVIVWENWGWLLGVATMTAAVPTPLKDFYALLRKWYTELSFIVCSIFLHLKVSLKFHSHMNGTCRFNLKVFIIPSNLDGHLHCFSAVLCSYSPLEKTFTASLTSCSTRILNPLHPYYPC